VIQGAYRLPTGTIVIPDEYQKPEECESVAVYARVSSSQNRKNLEKQAERISQFCNENGWVVKRFE
jgi:predicted site-specific integrase-resolvase